MDGRTGREREWQWGGVDGDQVDMVGLSQREKGEVTKEKEGRADVFVLKGREDGPLFARESGGDGDEAA